MRRADWPPICNSTGVTAFVPLPSAGADLAPAAATSASCPAQNGQTQDQGETAAAQSGTKSARFPELLGGMLEKKNSLDKPSSFDKKKAEKSADSSPQNAAVQVPAALDPVPVKEGFWALIGIHPTLSAPQPLDVSSGPAEDGPAWPQPGPPGSSALAGIGAPGSPGAAGSVTLASFTGSALSPSAYPRDPKNGTPDTAPSGDSNPAAVPQSASLEPDINTTAAENTANGPFSGIDRKGFDAGPNTGTPNESQTRRAEWTGLEPVPPAPQFVETAAVAAHTTVGRPPETKLVTSAGTSSPLPATSGAGPQPHSGHQPQLQGIANGAAPSAPAGQEAALAFGARLTELNPPPAEPRILARSANPSAESSVLAGGPPLQPVSATLSGTSLAAVNPTVTNQPGTNPTNAAGEPHAIPPPRSAAKETTSGDARQRQPEDSPSAETGSRSDAPLAGANAVRTAEVPQANALQREPHVAAPPETARPTEILPPPEPAKTLARDIRLQVTGGDSQVDVRLTERGGEVHVSVRTPDPRLASTLREDLPMLSARLEQTGFHAETWHPGSLTPEHRLNVAEPHSSGMSPNSQDPERQGSQQGQHQGAPRRPKLPEADASADSPSKDFSWLMSSLG